MLDEALGVRMRLEQTNEQDCIDTLLIFSLYAIRFSFFIFISFLILTLLIELDHATRPEDEPQKAEEIRQWCRQYMPETPLKDCNPDTAW